MSETFSAEDRKNIILAAFAVAGPGASDDAVAVEAQRAARLLLDGSAAQTAFDDLARQQERIDKVGHVKGTLIAIGREQLSNDVVRGVVVLFTGITQKNPSGKEFFRSDILGDATSNEPGNVIMRQAQGLIGNVVVVHKVVEKMSDNSGHGVRVVRGIKPLSPDTNYDANNPQYQAVWDNPDQSTAKMIGRTQFARVQALQPA